MSSDPQSAPTTEREVEIKLRVHGLYKLPDLISAGLAARARQQSVRKLAAVYHDTADLRLFRWGVTMRRREGGPDAGWHIKLPVNSKFDGVRDEIHLPLTAGEIGDVPQAFRTIVAPLARNEPLIPVASIHTTRTPYLLYDKDGEAFAELVDDYVSILDGERVVEQFREVEIEALTEDAQLDDIAELFLSTGATRSTASKAASALGPQASGEPDVLEPEKVSTSDPAADAITAFLRKYIRAFINQDVRMRRDLPDSVHQMRVAARRLRSGLKAFGPLVEQEWADKLRTELGWAAGELGVARDTEVLLERLDEHAEHLGQRDAALVRAVIDPQLQARLDSGRSSAIASLSSPRHLALLDALVDAAANPRVTELASEESREVLPELVDRAFRQLARRVKRLELEGPSDSWHRARISAKRARYAAEAVTNVFGAPAERLADALSEITEILGDHQDACVAQDVLREVAGSPDIDGKTGFALGLLHEYEFETELHNRLEFEKIWPHVRRVHKSTRLR